MTQPIMFIGEQGGSASCAWKSCRHPPNDCPEQDEHDQRQIRHDCAFCCSSSVRRATERKTSSLTNGEPTRRTAQGAAWFQGGPRWHPPSSSRRPLTSPARCALAAMESRMGRMCLLWWRQTPCQPKVQACQVGQVGTSQSMVCAVRIPKRASMIVSCTLEHWLLVPRSSWNTSWYHSEPV